MGGGVGGGVFRTIVIFEFSMDCGELSCSFAIGKFVEYSPEIDELVQQFRSAMSSTRGNIPRTFAANKRRARNARHLFLYTLRVSPPPSSVRQVHGGNWRVIGAYRVEKKIKEVFFRPRQQEQRSSRRRFQKKQIQDLGLDTPLTAANYFKRFKTLLHLEELQLEVEMNKHDLEDVLMTATPDRRHLVLAVPDLMERRPSVRVADVVEVTYSRNVQPESGMPVPNGVKYRGYVAVVRKDDILIHVPQELQSNHRDNESVYDIRFFLGRVMEKRKHHALHLLQSQVEWVFPSPEGMGEVSRTLLSVSPKVIKRAVEDSSNVAPLLNEEQGKAFQDIIRLTELSIGGGGKWKPKVRVVPPPYILHGPPGTGKTTTIVKAICHIYKWYPSSRILACAATNSAADSLLLGLVGCGITSILRLNAHTRPLDGLNPVPVEVMRYSNRHSGGGFQTPTCEELLGHRVVISTSCSASGVWQAGMQAEQYSHVFVDEASSMVEPECLIPIACCLHPQSVVVLSGDPQQLGPVVHCLLCKGMDGRDGGGLETSLLERLMTSEPSKSIYMNGLAHDGGCGPVPRFFATKLVKNYRSHPAILELPSQLFYNNELVAELNVQQVSSLCSWDELPNKNEFPILFHGMDGTAMRDEGSPSFFNAEECAQVVRYVEKLLADQTLGLRSAEIGVVAPYRRQVQKLQNHLHIKLQLHDVKVGSVEEFQGQERRVIILTTVRSDPAFIQDEYTQNIGFIKNPKRLNVAITRAMHLLIIVGNPKALKPDVNWRKLLEYCVENNAYVGCPLAIDSEKL